jgi:hypothetical protein
MTITPTPTTTRAAPPRRRLGGKRIALIVAGGYLALQGAGLLVAGGVVVWLDQWQDSDGYFTAGPGRFTTDTYAIAAPSLDVSADGPDSFYDQDALGEVRIQFAPLDAGASLFVGIGPAEDVAAYLDRVNYDEIEDLEFGPFGVEYTEQPGGAPAADPVAQPFWVASDSGTGPRTLTWEVVPGDWAVVVMNADGSAGVQADVSAGASLPIFGVAAVVSLIAGSVLLLGGAAMVVATLATRGPRPRQLPATSR